MGYAVLGAAAPHLPDIARIINAANPLQRRVSVADLKERGRHSVILVAIEAGRVVGTLSVGGPAALETLLAGKGGAFIYAAAVHPNDQRKGIMSFMVKEVLAILKGKGFTHVDYQATASATGTQRIAAGRNARIIRYTDDGLVPTYRVSL